MEPDLEMTQQELDFVKGTNHFTENQMRKADPDYIQPKVETEEKKMATLRESAMAYVPQQTLNIADLDKFPIDIELKDGSGTGKDGEMFTYKYAEIDGKQYRVAGSIIGGIKAILQKMPGLQQVSVIKQGEGMNTRYQVIPADAPIETIK